MDSLKRCRGINAIRSPLRKFRFLESHFEWMTEYLRKDGVRRNSLAESGMRVLRRLEIEHDGFRSEKGRDNADLSGQRLDCTSIAPSKGSSHVD